MTKIFVLRVSGNCDIRGIRTTTVCDVKMMYSQERYMENVPKEGRRKKGRKRRGERRRRRNEGEGGGMKEEEEEEWRRSGGGG